MSAFSAAYQHDPNEAWLNDLLRGIIDPNQRAESTRSGRTSRNDNVITPDLDDQIERPRAARTSSRYSAPSRRSFSSFSWHSRTSSRQHNRTISDIGVHDPNRESAQQTRNTPTPSVSASQRVSDSKSPVRSSSRASRLRTDEQRAVFHSPTPSHARVSSSGSDTKTLLPPEGPQTRNLKAILESSEDLSRADSISVNGSIDDEKAIFKFAPHPAVRPLASREVLGQAAPPSEDDGDHQYPGPLALSLIITGICLSVFIISVDRNIVTTVSIPFLPWHPFHHATSCPLSND